MPARFHIGGWWLLFFGWLLSGAATAGTTGLVGSSAYPSLEADLARELPGEKIVLYKTIGELPSDTRAPDLLLVFSPLLNRELGQKYTGTVIWVAVNDEEAVYLNSLAASPSAARWVALPSPGERAVLLSKLFPLSHNLAVLWRSSDYESWAGESRRIGSFHVLPRKIDTPEDLRAVDKEAEAGLWIGPPGDVLDLFKSIEESSLLVVVSSPEMIREPVLAGCLKSSPAALAKSLAGQIQSLRAGTPAPAELQFVDGPSVEVDLDTVRRRQGHLDLSAVQNLNGRIRNGTEEVSAIEEFLRQYKAALENQDESAYMRLWSGGPSAETLAGFKGLMASASAVKLEFSAPRILDFRNRPEAIELRVGQWYTLVDRKTQRSVSTPRVVIHFTLARDGERWLIREVSVE